MKGGKTLKRTIVVAFLVGILLPAAGWAQERNLEITGFFGGLNITQDLGSVENVYFTAAGAAENASFGKYYGFRVGYIFAPWIGLEGNFSQGKNSYTFDVVNDVDLDNVALGEQFDAKQTYYGGNLLLQYDTGSGLVPYGTVGFGFQKNEPTESITGVESTSGTDINFGGGIRYFLEGPDMPWLGFRFDFRYHMISDGLAFAGNEVSPRHTEFTLGVVLRPF